MFPKNAIYSRRRRTAWNWQQWRLLCLANNAERECKAWNSLRGGGDEGEPETRDEPRGKAAGKSGERKRFIVLAAPEQIVTGASISKLMKKWAEERLRHFGRVIVSSGGARVRLSVKWEENEKRQQTLDQSRI